MVKPDELVTLIRKHYWHKIKYVKHKTKDGSEVSYKTYSFEAKLKDCKVPIKFVVVFGKWNKEDDKKFHILITNQLKASPRTVIKNYLLMKRHNLIVTPNTRINAIRANAPHRSKPRATRPNQY